MAWKVRVDRLARGGNAHGEESAEGDISPGYRRTPRYFYERIRRDPRVRRLKRRILRPRRVTKADIVRGLREVGVRKGDEVMFHSALSKLGDVEGGADTVIDAYLEAVGPEGTVMMPSYAAYNVRSGPYGSWWDPASTPVYTGRISEVFWRRPGALRSAHPTHAIAAMGRRAEYFTSGHGIKGDCRGQWDTGEFATWSPWEKMVQEDIHYMLIGVVRACTLGYHAMARIVAEHLAGFPEAEADGLATALLNLYYNPRGVSPRVPTKLRAAYLKRWRRGAPVGTPAEMKELPPLERPCRPNRVKIGSGIYWRFSAAEYFHWCMDVMRREPEAWMDRPYLDWKARVDQRRREIDDQDTVGDIPRTWIRREYT